MDNIGATWIFTHPPGDYFSWSQVTKLVGTGGNVTQAYQGWSVSLSADGLTLAVGGPGPYFDSQVGATWIFSRQNIYSAWTQVTKLVGTGNIGASRQGSSVSLSPDGLTLAVGGFADDGYIGATWLFKNIGGTWSQVTKLVGTGNIGNAQQGYSVDLSGDALTLAVGGYGDDNDIGATWMFHAY